MTLRRYAPMKPSHGTTIPLTLRHEVLDRDGHCVCDRAGFPPEIQAVCQRLPVELDHVRGSGALGRKSATEASNLTALSNSCHRWKTEHGREARPLLLAYLSQFEDGAA